MSFRIQTGERTTIVAPGCAPFLIAECCNNFQGSMDIALAMIAQAAKDGAHAVKFQHRGRLKYYDLRTLRNAAVEAGLHFLCTGYTTEGQCELVGYTTEGQCELVGWELVDTLKVGSAEATDIDYLKSVARMKRSTIVATGCMAAADVRAIRAIFEAEGTPLALMHTVSIYPTPIEMANLCAFQATNFGPYYGEAPAIGYSDHTATIEAVTAAIVLGASIIEMHYTLSRELPGPDQCVSFEPKEFASIARFARAWPTMRDHPTKVVEPEERTKIDLFRKEAWRR